MNILSLKHRWILGCVALVKIQIRILNPKTDFLFLWANPNKDFESIDPILRKESIDSIQIRICLHLKSKHSIGNGLEKSTHGQRGLANNIVPNLLSFVHISMTSRFFVV